MTRHPCKKIKVSSSRFDTLPDELLTEVLGRVAASSITDIFNAKLSCKRLNEVGEDKHVYQRVPLDKFPIYQQAVLDYFNKANLRSTCINLQKALKRGHMGAIYNVRNLHRLAVDRRRRTQTKGIKMLGNMGKSGDLKKKLGKYRWNLIKMLGQMWVKNPFLVEPPLCCTTRDQHQRRRRWSDEEDDVS